MAREIEHPKPVADQETRGYWEGAGRHELVLQRCRRCGTVQHRPRALCVSCLGGEIELFVASGRGSVAVPYVLAYVELEEGPRLLTNVVGCPPDEVRIGMPVRAEFRADADGLAVPVFRPA